MSATYVDIGAYATEKADFRDSYERDGFNISDKSIQDVFGGWLIIWDQRCAYKYSVQNIKTVLNNI